MSEPCKEMSVISQNELLSTINCLYQRIPPVWPLNAGIAVNPWHFSSNENIEGTLAYWQTFSRANTLPHDLHHSMSSGQLKKVLSVVEFYDKSALTTLNQALFDFYGAQVVNENKLSLYDRWYRNNPAIIATLKSKIDKGIPHISSCYLSTLQGLLNFIQPATIEPLLFNLLTQCFGFASYLAYKSQRNLHIIGELICIRLCYECHYIITHDLDLKLWKQHYLQANVILTKNQRLIKKALKQLEAKEKIYQQSIARHLTFKTDVSHQQVKAQAIFCIDPRSERIRRHLEQAHPSIKTHGVAGFFSIPLSVGFTGSKKTLSCLPAILSSNLHATLKPTKGVESQLTKNIKKTISHHPFLQFQFIEMTGLTDGLALLKATFSRKKTSSKVQVIEALEVANKFTDNVKTNELVNLAESFLRSTSITDFTDDIYIFGHQSDGDNNAEIAHLQCGACGGQSGAYNATVVCEILNSTEIRKGLVSRGLSLPETTQFIPGVHETVTDNLFLTSDTIDAKHKDIQASFITASSVARKEKEASLPSRQFSKSTNQRATERSTHLSFVRTEWGLARNASFIIGPRTLTQAASLEARTFLHDYDHHLDKDGSLLQSIFQGPVLVTSWINLQYYASTVDNQVFGSGNKVTQQVILNGDAIIQGDGGDIRFGLSEQSVFNASTPYHEPLRLSVFIAAPQKVIEEALSKAPEILQLFNNGWLNLLQISCDDHSIKRWSGCQWHSAFPE